jgi:hypothetical protein
MAEIRSHGLFRRLVGLRAEDRASAHGRRGPPLVVSAAEDERQARRRYGDRLGGGGQRTMMMASISTVQL